MNILKIYQEKIKKINFFIKLRKDFFYKINPLLKKWELISKREKSLIILLGIVFILYLMINLFISIVNFTEEISIKNNNLQLMLVKATKLEKEYENISQFSPNKFSEVTINKIKDDMNQIMDIKYPNIILEDNLLVIKGENIKFENVIQLLGQFRNTYGIFPLKLVLTKVGPDIVNFYISFMVK
jgi:hypothetical protein